jgi:hypothetical protein
MSRDTQPLSILDAERDWLVADYWRMTRRAEIHQCWVRAVADRERSDRCDHRRAGIRRTGREWRCGRRRYQP